MNTLHMAFWRAGATGLLALVAAAGTGHADTAAWPERPIRVVVPYPPGGNLGITTRAVVAGMSRAMGGHTLVVENVPGAGGSIGTTRVARADADGYTVLATTVAPLFVNPVMLPDFKITVDDFDPIGMMAVVPAVLDVHPQDARFPDFAGFIDYVKRNPGQVSIGHAGNGTTIHLAVLQLMRDFGLDVIPVAYKGGGPALTDMLGGQIDALVDQLTSSRPHIETGRLRALAATAGERVPTLAAIPAVAESLPHDFEVVTVSGLLAPRGTPLVIRQKLNTALRAALADPDVQSQLTRLGAQTVATDINQTTLMLQREQAKLQALIDSGMLKLE